MSGTCVICKYQVYLNKDGLCKYCADESCVECYVYVEYNDDNLCYFCCKVVCEDCSRTYRPETVSHRACKYCLGQKMSNIDYEYCSKQCCYKKAKGICLCCNKIVCHKHLSNYYCSDCSSNVHNGHSIRCDRCRVRKCVGNEICRQKNFGNDTKNCTDCFRTNRNAIYTFLSFMRFRNQHNVPYDVAKLIAKMSRI